MRTFIVVVGLIAAASVASLARGPRPAPYCQPGEAPRYALGFASLAGRLGETMGEPVECAHPDVVTGDVLQRTSRGLAFYRQRSNTSSFSNGFEHWALTAGGLVYWTGEGLDPPATAAPAPELGGAEAAGFDPRRYIGQGKRYTCSDFASQAQAQAVLRADPHDPNRLDRSREGVACRMNPPPRDLEPVLPRPCPPTPAPGMRASGADVLATRGCAPTPTPTPGPRARR